MQSIESYQKLINQQLQELRFQKEPESLFAPIQYFLQIGGKRIRPILTLLGCKMFGGEIQAALSPALAVEVFHNFTLLHDDLMDEAPLRRNKPTVHEAYNANTAILSGDAMLIQAYALLNEAPSTFVPELMRIFNIMAMDVCRGQQYDMLFETRSDVQLEEYLEMIRLKTAVLLGTALQIGARIAGASAQDAAQLYLFGESVGMAFQLQDDYLDAFGQPEDFGKQIGGDILANKKTYLLIQALQTSNQAARKALLEWIHADKFKPQDKVQGVLEIYRDLQIDKQALQEVQNYSEKAKAALDAIALEDAENKTALLDLCQSLMRRTV